MANDVQIPDYLKKYVNQDVVADNNAMIQNTSIPRVSLRGKKFRFTEGKDVVKKPTDEIYVIILAVEPGSGLFVKTYYEGTYSGTDDANPPRCSSQNGITPDPWISNPVSSNCATCPMNVFGSAKSRSGGKAKACKDSKHLWVVDPEDIQGTVYCLGVPISSLKNMSAYARFITQNNLPISAVITKIRMDDDSEYPLLNFEYVGVLQEEPLKLSMKRKEAQDWDMPKMDALPAPKPTQTLEHVASAPDEAADDLLIPW